ncbi:mitotubule-associated protein Gb4, putative, partial [Trypanosoma vivax Y486]
APRISVKLIDERLDACEYEGVWALYEVPPRESSVLTRTFEGDGWGRVVDSSREELERAFRNDTARALRVAAEQVAVVSLRVGSLHVGYRVTACTLSDAEIVQLLAVHDYPEVWALYKPPTRSTEARSERTVSEPRSVVVADVVTQHHVEFEGADWDYVLGSKMTELLRAFVADTARQLGVEEGCVHDVAVGLGKSGLLVDFMLRHAPRISVKLIDERLDACEYEGVWALYEVPPRESSVLTRTFEGDGWGRVVDSSREELERAFRNDTARALRVAAEQVAVVSLRVGSLLVGYRVTACTLSDAEIVQLLAVHDYPEVWALYKPPTRSTEARSERTVSEPRSVVVADVVTQHHVGFSGCNWMFVVHNKLSDLRRCFVSDCVKNFGVCEDVFFMFSFNVHKNGLLISFNFRHCSSLSLRYIDSMLDSCDFEAVWVLYIFCF